MNKAAREAARRRCEEATPGPWTDRQGHKQAGLDGPTVLIGPGKVFFTEADARFIAHARTELPTALDEIDRLEAMLDRAIWFLRPYNRFAPMSDVTKFLADHAAMNERSAG